MTHRRALPKTIGELGVALRGLDSVWVRRGWCLEQQDWRLRLLEVITGLEPPDWEASNWTYPGASFASSRLPGSVLGRSLENALVSIDGHEHALGSPDDRLYWERRESRIESGYQVLDWPSYEVQLGQLQMNEPQRPLLSDDDAPSFASFYNAAASFFQRGVTFPGGSLPTFGVYRWIDARARINSVEIREDDLQVEIEGEGLAGLTVELAGDAPGQARALEAERTTATVTFPLADGLPSGAWVVVRSGSEWLDRRFLAPPWAGGQQAGVDVAVPAKTRLDAYVSGRENDVVEFKREIPKTDDSKARVMKTVCAFANGGGGSLLFGIDDDYNLTGLPAVEANRLIDRLSELVDAWVEPAPAYAFEVLPIEGTAMVVIELIVSSGTELFGSSKPNQLRRVYVRHHSRSVPARVREIEALVRSRGTHSGGRYPY